VTSPASCTFSTQTRFIDRHREFAALAGLVVLAGLLFFFRLGTPRLFDADEPAYAEAAREMVRTGDWITPRFDGQPRFDKPILFYWLIALSYTVFGVTEFAVRFWSALGALALVFVLYRAGAGWFGPRVGLLAGLAFTMNFLTALLARAAVTDMLLTFFVTAAILAGIQALGAPAPAARSWARLGWIAMSLAVLVKGPIGLVIPGMALGGSVLVLREVRGGFRRLFPWEGPALFLALAVPWFALVWFANGWAFIQGFVIKHHLTRYTGVVSGHPGPIWFYLPVALVGFFPWSGYLPLALWRAVGAARRGKVQEAADRVPVVCLCWIVGVFLFFSFAETKLPSYLFPAFPGMALLVGWELSSEKRTTDNRPTVSAVDQLSVVRCPLFIRSVAPWLIGLTGFILAGGLAAVPLFWEALRPAARGVLNGVSPPFGLTSWLAGLLAAGTAGGLLAKGAWRLAVLAGMMVCLIVTAEVAVAPRAYAILQQSLYEYSRDAARILGPGDPVVTYGLNAPSVVFYADRHVIPLGADRGGTEKLEGMLRSGRPIVVITRAVYVRGLDRLSGLFQVGVEGGYAAFSSARPAMPAGGQSPDLPVTPRP
jgi:4-amino-4-deoxy-L-arabinose transferase-like glycosyltransferase